MLTILGFYFAQRQATLSVFNFEKIKNDNQYQFVLLGGI